MAEIILSGIVESLTGTLTDAAVEKIVSIWRAKKQLSGLQKTISSIEMVLLDAEEKQNHNHQIRNWLKELEDVVYEADDLFDGINTEALRRQLIGGSSIRNKVHTFFSSSNQLVFRHDMARKIKDIKKKLAAISKNRNNLKLEVRPKEETLKSREDTHSYIPEEYVLGREDDREAILDLLLDPINIVEKDVSILPIVGLGGLGKTTLAQFVFNHEMVQTHFDLKMWVCVSENFDVRLLVKKIIESARKTSIDDRLEMDILQEQLREKIKGKRYLLVLDDVWEEDRELWLKLKNLLSNGAKGSRILITTRSKKVGEITCTMEPYMLRILNKDDSWSLFKCVAFKDGQEPKNSNTLKSAMEIVDKCGGIPLAIRAIGSMLYDRDPETEWSFFLQMEFSKLDQVENDILSTLKFSYNKLTSHLKKCFAYCSLFPKDFSIIVDDLIKLWMAQGFIKSSSFGLSLEEVGYEYFKQLHWRSFFQEVEENKRTEKLECKMHDLMHDLAVNVAGSECAALRSIEGKIDHTTRHVSVDWKIDPSRTSPTFFSKENKIRTIIFPSERSIFDADNVLALTRVLPQLF